MLEVDWLKMFSSVVCRRMQELNISQRELADMVCTSKSSISRILSNRQMPSIKTVHNIFHYLRLDDEMIMELFQNDVIR